MNDSTAALELTDDEFSGFASCLAQLTNMNVRYRDGAGAPRDLTRDEFLGALGAKDAELARSVASWWDAAAAVRAHLVARCAPDLRPAEPVGLGVGGHAF